MTQEEALRKAVGCLKLAEGATKLNNIEEAAAAMAAAQKIIDKYNLDINAADFDDREAAKDKEEIKNFGHSDPVDVVPPMGLHGRGWALRLLSVIARVNGCKAYYANVDSKGTKKLMVIGRPSDVNVVRYLYGYFKQEVVRLRRENTQGNSTTYANHYCIGLTEAIASKLVDQKRHAEAEVRGENAHNPNALIRVNNAIVKQQARETRLAEWVKANTGLKPGRSSGYANSETGGREHGRRDGDKVRFTKAKASLQRTGGQLN